MLVPEVQNLDIISVNIWQILVSLLNLLLLFLIIKKFLYKPVKKALDMRRASIDAQYADAEKAKMEAASDKEAWEARLSAAESDANAIIDNARTAAKRRSDDIIAAADDKAKSIIHRAESDAALEMKKAKASIKGEIIDVSVLLTEKMIGRELNSDDHRELIDSFIDGIDEVESIGEGSNGDSK